jgi:hypothetical protein
LTALLVAKDQPGLLAGTTVLTSLAPRECLIVGDGSLAPLASFFTCLQHPEHTAPAADELPPLLPAQAHPAAQAQNPQVAPVPRKFLAALCSSLCDVPT